MNFLSVCSGIEAASVAWSPLGWKAVAFSEIEPFPCAVLAHHYHHVPNWGDMTKFKDWPDAAIDLLCGGTPCQSFSVAGLRKGLDEGFDASEDGTGRGTPLVPVSVALRGREGGATIEMGDDLAFALRASSGGGDKPHVLAFDTTQVTSVANRSNPKPGDPCHPLAAGAHAHAPAIAFSGKDYGADATDELAPTLRAMNHADSHANGGGQMAVAYAIQAGALRTNPESGPDGVGVQADKAYTLEARAEVQCVGSAMQVRRLTPEECEALQGFPRGYTAIPWRKNSAAECPDGPRYKALGNSWAVPNVRWIGRRIDLINAIREAA